MKVFISLICMLSLFASCSSNKDEETLSLLPELIYLNMADVQDPLNKYGYLTDLTTEDSININMRTGEVEHFYTTNKYGKIFLFILTEKDSMITEVSLRSDDFSNTADLENLTSKVKTAFVEEWSEPLQDSGTPEKGETPLRVILWEGPIIVGADYKALSFSLRTFQPN